MKLLPIGRNCTVSQWIDHSMQSMILKDEMRVMFEDGFKKNNPPKHCLTIWLQNGTINVFQFSQLHNLLFRLL